MNYYKDGKIYKIYKDNGVGYIVDEENKYLFTIFDVNTKWDELADGDLVRFRAEQINDTNRARFVKKNNLVNENKKPIV